MSTFSACTRHRSWRWLRIWHRLGFWRYASTDQSHPDDSAFVSACDSEHRSLELWRIANSLCLCMSAIMRASGLSKNCNANVVDRCSHWHTWYGDWRWMWRGYWTWIWLWICSRCSVHQCFPRLCRKKATKKQSQYCAAVAASVGQVAAQGPCRCQKHLVPAQQNWGCLTLV